MSNIPEGSDTPNAPWNEESKPSKRIEVTVSMTINKTFPVLTDNYDVEYDKDEDGNIKEIVYINDINVGTLVEDHPDLLKAYKYLEDTGWIISDVESDIYDY